MRAWILSIVGIVFLGVMVDVISPNGKMNGFIKSIFAIMTIFVIISPIINITKLSFDSVNMTYTLDDGLISTVLDQKISILEQQTIKALIDSGYTNVGVKIEGKLSSNEVNISLVHITCDDSVLYPQEYSIDYCNNIRNIVSSVLSVDKEVIMFG